MSPQPITTQPAEEEKLQILQQLREIKKSLRGNPHLIGLLSEKEKKSEAAAAWEERRRKKVAAGKKVNIIFVCSRPAAWGVFKSTCEAFIEDKRCNVKIVSIPEIKGFGAWQYVNADYGVNCRVIEGYRPHLNDWLDIKLLEPDYVFFQTPYNGLRPRLYNSSVVSRYAKICYALYGNAIFSGAQAGISTPTNFLSDVFAVFAQTGQYARYLAKVFKDTPGCDGKIVLSGDARLEDIRDLPPETESPLWHYPRSAGKFRLVWTPRWTKKDNFSHFWDYRDKIIDLCRQEPGLELVSRPHPLIFTCMSAQETAYYKKLYAALPNASLDSRDVFHDTFVSSDALLTDATSVFHDYMITGKPIIYCHRRDGLSEHSLAAARGFYWARSWPEIIDILQMLRSGEDPLKEKRQRIISEIYYMPPIGVRNVIKNCVMDHFFAGREPEAIN